MNKRRSDQISKAAVAMIASMSTNLLRRKLLDKSNTKILAGLVVMLKVGTCPIHERSMDLRPCRRIPMCVFRLVICDTINDSFTGLIVLLALFMSQSDDPENVVKALQAMQPLLAEADK
jgi:hypothetical protein